METSVILVTGYLGAGKTTLLRRIISDSGRKIAVLMNEFGRIGIDGRVLGGKDVKIMELTGGCICCSLSGELVAAIEEISASKPDAIVIETTGLAEPSTIARDISRMESVSLDAVITIVDADALLKSPNIGHTGMEQIELADLILLNKKDLVPDIHDIEIGLMKLNPHAELIPVERCGIGMEKIFGIRREKRIPETSHGLHNPGYFDFVCSQVDHDGFIALLDSLKGIIRAKGFVKTEKGDFLMDYVSGRHTMEPFVCVKTELVFIGNDGEAMRAIEKGLIRIRRN
jgi:G3E family GTPase